MAFTNSHSNVSDYADLEIRILKCEDSGYPVELTLNHEVHYERGWLSANLPSGNTSSLQSWFFADPNFKTSWTKAMAQFPRCRLRLRMDAESPELHALPWELLSNDKTFFAADATTPFSRYWLTDVPLDEPLSVHPLKVLVVISNPSDLEQYQSFPLDVSTEQALLETPFQQLSPKYVQLDFLFAPVTLDRLETALGEGYQVLHFVGHGAFNRSKQQTELYFQDTTDAASPVAEADIVSLFQRLGSKQRPRLVVLEACHSAAMVGVEHGLLSVGIPAVVAMQDTITVDSARQLTRVFYEQLVQHGRVDVALNRARSNLLSVNRSDAGVPVLFMRLQDGQLWQPIWSLVNPYRGLAAFKTEDADFFFGREKLIQELLERTRQQCFLAVVGSSGSGKSSVVQAGLLPRLPQDWNVVVFRPGADPWAALQAVGLPGLAEKEIVQATEGKPLLLFIDQFEELFTLTPAKMRTPFLEALQKLIESYVLAKVVLALRADFYGYLQSSPLGRLLDQNVVNVLPLEAAEFQEAIVKPADKVGLCFEPGLVEIITTEIKTVNQPLPLLQSALTQLWERQKHGWLTQSAYVAVGRVAGAMGLWADKAFGQMGEEERVLARRILTRLVYYGETDVGDTRRRCTLEELAGAASEVEFSHRLVKELADARLLTTIDEGGVVKVEIIHDALLHQWGKLREWIAEQREFGLWRQWLDAQRETWKSKSRDESTLLRGKLLTEAEFWLQKRPGELNPLEKEYIQAGIALREREQRAKALLQQKILGGMAIALAVFLVLTVAAGMGWRSSILKENARATAQAEALAEATRALDAEATAEAQVQIALARQLAAQARDIWDRQPSQLSRAVLLSLESLQRYPESSSSEVLNEALFLLPHEITRMTYKEEVTSVAFSPDGRWVASGSLDGTVRVWETMTGKIVMSRNSGINVRVVAFNSSGQQMAFGGCDKLDNNSKCVAGIVKIWDFATGRETSQTFYNGEVRVLAFSPDGQWIASGDVSGGARVWNVTTGKEVVSVTQASPVWVVDFSRNGREVLLGGGDAIGVWDMATGQENVRMAHEKMGIRTAVFSFDGTRVVSGSEDHKVRIWDVATGNMMLSMTHESEVWMVAFSPDGTQVVSGSSDGTARMWDAMTGKEIARMEHEGYVVTVVFSPDGQWWVSGSGDGTACLWDTKTGKEFARMIHGEGVNSVAFSPDGRLLVSGGDDGTVRVWEVITNAGWRQMISKNIVNVVEFSGNEQWVVSGGWDGVLQVWNMVDSTKIWQREQGHGILTMALSPNGQYIVSGENDGTARVWETETGKEISRMTHGVNVVAVAFSPNAKWVVSAGCDEQNNKTCIRGTARVWDAITGIEVSRIIHDGGVLSVAFSHDGRRVVSGGNDGMVRVWNATTGKEITRMIHEGYVETVTFSPDDQQIASGSLDGTARVWDVTTGKEVSQMTYKGGVHIVNFSPDGHLVVAAGGDGNVGTWEVETGREVSRMAHEEYVYSAVFSPDGKWVASGGCDRWSGKSCTRGSARVWDAMTGKEVSRMTYAGGVTDVAFSADGRRLISGGCDAVQGDLCTRGLVRVWWWSPEDLATQACENFVRNLTKEEWEQYLGNEPYRATCPNLPIEPEPTPTP